MSSPAQYRDEAEWLKVRATGIGGSDCAAVVGLDPYRTRIDVYKEKLGLAEPRPDTPAMMRGRLLEPVACDLYTKLTGRKLRRQPLRRHPEYPFILCSLDRQILANGDERGTGLLEVKAPGLRVFSRMKREGLPRQYILQMMHNLGVWGYAWGSYAIFSAELWSLVWFDVQRDDAFVETLFEQERAFWSYVERREEPPPVQLAVDLPMLELPPVEGQIVQRDDAEWAEAADTLKQARSLRETAEAVEAQAIAKVKELMGEHRVVEGADLRAYHTLSPGRVTFDKKALVGARPLDPLAVGATVSMWAERLKRIVGPIALAEIDVGSLLTSLGDTALDLTKFDRVGKPFTTFKPFFLKPAIEEEE